MIEKKFENEKFLLIFKFNNETEKFEKMEYVDKKLNELEKKILNEICLLFTKCEIHELYEHLIIRVENKLRNFYNTNYSGIIFAENISEEYKYFKYFFRNFLKSYIKKNLSKSINFQTIKPSAEWIKLTSEKKIEEIYNQLDHYVNLNHELVKKLKIVRIENNVDIYIKLPAITDINTKNKMCLDIEIFIKKNLDESLNIYLKTLTDENKIRRLSL
jgi:hypothetical protein